MSAPVAVAERALLGGLLTEPHRLTQVRDWLEPADFADPRHGAAYAAMLSLAEAGDPVTPQGLTAVLDASPGVRFARRQDRDVLVADLLAAPGSAALVATYARMVLEASIARAVEAEGVRLQQVASREVDPPEVARRLDERLADAGQVLDGLQRRWATAPSPFSSDLGSAVGRVPLRRLAADDVAAEDAALGALLRDPRRIGTVREWLQPEDFTAPGRAELYGLLTELHQRRTPIEPVTVVWEAHRRGLLDRPRLSAEHVLRLGEHAPAGDPAFYAAQVLAGAVRARAFLVGGGLRRFTARGQLPPEHLLAATRQQLATLRGDRRRLGWALTTSHPRRSLAGTTTAAPAGP